MLDSVVRLIRSDDSSGQINNDVEWLSGHCTAEYDVFADYQSARGTTGVAGTNTCESWTRYIGSDAIALLREDGLCTDGHANIQPAAT
ncbi:MAG: hypothetical protein HGA44_01080 [Cellulomonadaceae bacterium]|nr:hypothetical protein [Cellulomonadaceae bacterium]